MNEHDREMLLSNWHQHKWGTAPDPLFHDVLRDSFPCTLPVPIRAPLRSDWDPKLLWRPASRGRSYLFDCVFYTDKGGGVEVETSDLKTIIKVTFGDLRSLLTWPPSIVLFDAVIRALLLMEDGERERAEQWVIDHLDRDPRWLDAYRIRMVTMAETTLNPRLFRTFAGRWADDHVVLPDEEARQEITTIIFLDESKWMDLAWLKEVFPNVEHLLVDHARSWFPREADCIASPAHVSTIFFIDPPARFDTYRAFWEHDRAPFTADQYYLTIPEDERAELERHVAGRSDIEIMTRQTEW